MNYPAELLRNPHFSRYFRTWQKNYSSVVFIPLAEICREQGYLGEAREICTKGLVHHPHSVSGRLLLARIYFELDRLEEAKKLVHEILSEQPAQKGAQTLLDSIVRTTHTDEVQKVSVPTSPASLWENVTMAKIYADQGEVKIALQILEKILSRNPAHTIALQLREELR